MSDVPTFEVEFTGDESEDEMRTAMMAAVIDKLDKEVSAEVIKAIKLGQVIMLLRDELRESGHGKGIQFLGSHGDAADRIADQVLAGLVKRIYEMAGVDL